MNGKLVVRTGLITAAVIAALACFCYNASYNPDFSAIDFITAASPKKKAKNRKDVQETVYSIQDFDLNEPLDGFDEIPVESGILLRRKTPHRGLGLQSIEKGKGAVAGRSGFATAPFV